MDIRSLKHAIALAEAGSFVRAADRLALSQSAVSRSILALEEGLGVVLFDRTPSGVHPTAAGRTLVASARRIVAEAEALRSEVALAQGEIAGNLIFGAVPALAVGYLPQIIAEGMRANPQLNYSLKVRVSSELLEQLRSEAIEFYVAVGGDRSPDPDLEVRGVGTLPGGGVFARPKHPLAQAKEIPAADILHYPLAVAGMERFLDRSYRQILHLQQAAKLRVQLVCDSLHVLQRVAIHSDTLLISSRMSMAGLIADGQLVELSLADDHSYEPGEIEIISLKGRSLSPAAQLLVNQLVDFLAGQAQN